MRGCLPISELWEENPHLVAECEEILVSFRGFEANYLSFWGQQKPVSFEVVSELISFEVEIYFSCWGDETPVWSWME